jgi:hypothetical protein
VRVRLVARRPARIELGGEHLEVLQRSRREQELAAEVAKLERGPALAMQHARMRPEGDRLEQVGDVDAQGRGDARERGDAGTRLPALDLAEEGLAQPGPLSDAL